jgi:hypothetical protein
MKEKSPDAGISQAKVQEARNETPKKETKVSPAVRVGSKALGAKPHAADSGKSQPFHFRFDRLART